MVLSWYEQKAVAILLTLLYLGIKNIRLGPACRRSSPRRAEGAGGEVPISRRSRRRRSTWRRF